MDVGPIQKAHRSERDYLGHQLMLALREVLPWGHVISLPNGIKATLSKMNGVETASMPKQMPIYKPGSSAVAGDDEIIGREEWSMRFDFMLENCDQDHVEMTIKITGGGGFA